MKYLLCLDQGTTGSTALILDQELRVISRGYCEVVQHYPQPGWVTHDPEQIFESVDHAVGQALASANIDPSQLAAIGITNQRETTVLWERSSGKSVHGAIVWQCRRSAPITNRWRSQGLEPEIQQRTGLLLDPYFSASKLVWLFEEFPQLRQRAQAGELCFGTIDSYLIFRLTGRHVTEPSNASRTMLYNLEGQWDPWILDKMEIPAAVLPEVLPSGGQFGTVRPSGRSGHWTDCPIPITGVLGDQQASLFGQACFESGQVKTTYGTGCFLMMNTGEKPIASSHRLLTTVAWQWQGKLTYALEGSVFSAGSAVQWLRDQLSFFKDASLSEELATSVESSQGVRFIPAFTGLGAPHWNSDIRAALLGVTRGTSPAHITRAVLEAVAFQTAEVVELMCQELGTSQLPDMRVDGGMVSNNFLMQLQADLLGTAVDVPECKEATAYGAGCMAALGLGWFESLEALSQKRRSQVRYQPQANPQARADYRDWQAFVGKLLA